MLSETQQILGFQAFYQLFNGKILAGASNLSRKLDETYTIASFSLENCDYIKEIAGFCSENEIISLCFVSLQGKKKQFGAENMKNRGFSLKIASFEAPICLYGAFSKENEGNLVMIGAEVVNDEVSEEIF